jgi:enterochelin esterase-like enzyme
MRLLLGFFIFLLFVPSTFGALGQDKTFKSNVNGQTYKYRLYLPPGFSSDGSKQYPVLFYLPGCGGNGDQVEEILPFFDKSIKAGKFPELVVAALYTGRCALIIGTIESVIMKDWIPLVEKNYRGIGTREARWIHGQSFGARGAFYLGSKYNDRFSAISTTGGALTKGKSNEQEASPWVAVQKYADQMRGKMLIRHWIGTKDEHPELIALNKEFDALLTKLKLDHEFAFIEGAGHSPSSQFSRYKGDPLDFYRKAYEKVNQTPEITLTLNLKKGWNLLGIPLTLANPDIGKTIKPIETTVVAIFSYDSTSGTYKTYTPQSSTNDFNVFESGKGYWAYLTQDASLPISGTIKPFKHSFTKGWNLFGYYGDKKVTIEEYFGSLLSKIEGIHSFEPVTGTYKSYIPGQPNQIDFLEPGRAYWISFKENADFTK